MTSDQTAIDQPFVFSPSLMTSVPGPPAQAARSAASDPLVTDVRREITEIIREVAQAVHEDRSEALFLTFVADRVLRAMAAEGIVIWRRDDRPKRDDRPNQSHPFVAAARLGRVTDGSIPSLLGHAHQLLLAQVAEEQQPVVVPATPATVDEKQPLNPTDFPAAVVPIQNDPTNPQWSHVLQVFLEPDCGVATQRGYLRFVAQMGDLTGEFLRIDRFRSVRTQQRLASAVDEVIQRMHSSQTVAHVDSITVDAIADVFSFDRVGLCLVTSGHAKLTAVSHVETIDQRSAAADQIRRAARQAKTKPCVWIVPTPARKDGDAAENQEDEIATRAVVSPETESPVRVVLMSKQEIDFETSGRELKRLVKHAAIARAHISRQGTGRVTRWLASGRPESDSSLSRWRRPVAVIGVMTLLLIAAMFPVPMIVVASATVRPADVQTLSAPRDVTVQQVHVTHGQSVDQGTLLMTLVDTDLQQEIVTLAGKRAVLAQQQARWTDAIIAAESSFADSNEQLQSEQRLVDEEIRSIDQQLSLMRSIEESLLIRADRSGVVDGWRVTDRLQSRPLRRGDHLLQVIASQSPWLVDAQVPQKRIADLQHGLESDLQASVSLLSRSSESHPASLVRIGPAITEKLDQPSTVVVLKVHHDALDASTIFRDTNVQSGAPARASLRCGSAPAIYWLFQDVIRATRSTAALYFSDFASETSQTGDQV